MAASSSTRKTSAKARKPAAKKPPTKSKAASKRGAKKPPAKGKKPPTRGKPRTSSSTNSTGRSPLSVRKAVEADLDALAKRDPSIATSARAATALAMAKAIDNTKASPTSKSMCARVLLDTLDRLLELVPPAEESDDLDELRSRRAARRATAAS